ncbi:MAG: hypothetical protein ACXV8T_15730, partial [Acidimicrobiia bacterium]
PRRAHARLQGLEDAHALLPVMRTDEEAKASQLTCNDAAMDLAAARAVLGVDDATAWPEVRASYLRLMRHHHPDNAFDLADSGRRTVETARITEAFAVLVSAQRAVVAEAAAAPAPGAPASTPGPETPGASLRHPTVALDDSRRVTLDAAPMDALLALHETFSILGAVSYIDRLSLVIETIVTPEPGRATSLLAWLDPVEGGMTEATLGVESLGGHPPADLDALVDRIAELLASPRPPVTEP